MFTKSYTVTGSDVMRPLGADSYLSIKLTEGNVSMSPMASVTHSIPKPTEADIAEWAPGATVTGSFAVTASPAASATAAPTP